MPSPPSNAGATANARVFHTLDALRGLAALGVVIFHMQPLFLPVGVPGGYLAVDLFFLMSGVVLSHAYEARFRAGMGTLQFMRVRLIRLYPLYLLGLAFGVVVTVASLLGRNVMGWDWGQLASATVLALLFLPNLSDPPSGQLFPLNIPSWSLFFELVVNLLFVMTWPLLSSRRLGIIAVLAGASLAVASFEHGNLDLGSTAPGLAIGLMRTLFGFSVGVLIARHIRGGRRAESTPQVLLILAIVLLVIAFRPAGSLRGAWDVASVIVAFPAIVWWSAHVDPGIRLRQVATFLGVTSYAIYVLHSPMAAVLNSLMKNSTSGMPSPPWVGIAVLALLLAGCWLVDRVYDAPVRRMLGRLSLRSKVSRPKAEATSNAGITGAE